MEFNEQLSEDQKIISENNYYLTVATQEKRGAPWLEADKKFTSVSKAIEFAKSSNYKFKACIFLYRDGGGFHYWATNHPDLLNSDVVTMKLTK